MATPFKWGPEFLVNTTTLDGQFLPSITGLANGRFVVAWTDTSATGGDTSGLAVRAQVFNADGTKFGTEILVPTTLSGHQEQPSITALEDGGFVVVWTDGSATGGDTSSNAVRAQMFNADGTASAAEFLVNTSTFSAQNEPSVTALADGGFVVAWSDLSGTAAVPPPGADTSNKGIRAQVFTADGTPSGPEFRVNTTTLNAQSVPSITTLADGRFVFAWQDGSQTGGDTSQSAVRAQVFNANGTPAGAEFLVNTETFASQIDPSVTALADGGFVIAWTDGSQTGGDTNGPAIRAQVFNTDNTKSGAEFLVNTTTLATQSFPSIAALADGRFVVAWTDNSATGGDTSGNAVRAQVFNVDGTKSGTEFLVNTATSGGQFDPTITVLADGRFVVAWTDASQVGGDTSQVAIRGQIFDPREHAISLNGTLDADTFVGTDFADTLRGSIGNDTLTGGLGGDTIDGEAGLDNLSGGGGDDTISGGLDNDALSGQVGNDILRGDAGQDQLTGDQGADQLHGGEGNDSLNGGSGIDKLEGGLGDDTYFVDTASDIVMELLGQGTDTVQSSTISLDLASYAEVENVTLLGSLLLTATGNAGANVLDGLSNTAANLLKGLGGNDTYIIGAGDTVDESVAGSGGVDTVQSALTYTLTANVENLTLTGGSAINGTGNTSDNVLTGNAGTNVLAGLGGNDTYIIGAGDTVDETTAGSSGIDTVQSSLTYTLTANVENLTLTGASAINGTGNASGNVLSGNAGANVLAGLGGNDTYIIGAGDTVNETAAGSSGIDTVQSALAYTLTTNVENLTLTGAAAINGTGNELLNTLAGNAGANTLSGLGGHDLLLGGAGSDKLNGGLGNDKLTGGLGSDAFVFNSKPNASSNKDTITDFNVKADVIHLENAIFKAIKGVGTLKANQFFKGSAAHDADDRIVYNSKTGALIYDANGNKAGGAIQIATLTGSPDAVTNADFFII